MITPAYIHAMAEYNAEMNRRLYGTAARLSDDERRLPRGAFWGSVHGTMTQGLLVTHFFNHQTHHRGQAHALLTAAGQETGDTDLFLVVPEIVGRA
jgi:uncharacterized damage-inducible protein DinB